MIEIFFCLLLHARCSILVSKSSNEIKNSTTKFSSLVLYSGNKDPFFVVKRSNITISRSEIVSSVPLISSAYSSSILLSRVSIGSLVPSSLIESSSDTITLQHSSITNLVIPHNDGTFLSSGYARIQKVVDCVFSNLSRGVEPKRGQERRWGISEEGILMDSVMERCEDSIYGLIVSGLSGVGQFWCKNSSLINNVRHSPTIKISLKKRLADECTYGSNTCNPSKRVSINTGPVTITDCTFSQLSSSQAHGGALSIVGSDRYINTVTISGCLFD